MKKIKQIKGNNLPLRGSIFMPFIIYTLVDYWSLPIWVFAIYMTLWVILFVTSLAINIASEKVDLLGNDK